MLLKSLQHICEREQNQADEVKTDILKNVLITCLSVEVLAISWHLPD